ncbi:DUF2992 family protein [Nonomuraea sp. NPDC052129]|uniref:DUF2992 family protein n=1 Tax=Nonomuraea sp. NPDC052129 TaxID=3154651 RepID=UPI0034276DA1
MEAGSWHRILVGVGLYSGGAHENAARFGSPGLEIVQDGELRAAKLAARAAARVSSRSTAAQEAMRLELESRKQEATGDRKDRREAVARHKREVAHRKRAERRRGR